MIRFVCPGSARTSRKLPADLPPPRAASPTDEPGCAGARFALPGRSFSVAFTSSWPPDPITYPPTPPTRRAPAAINALVFITLVLLQVKLIGHPKVATILPEGMSARAQPAATQSIFGLNPSGQAEILPFATRFPGGMALLEILKTSLSGLSCSGSILPHRALIAFPPPAFLGRSGWADARNGGTQATS